MKSVTDSKQILSTLFMMTHSIFIQMRPNTGLPFWSHFHFPLTFFKEKAYIILKKDGNIELIPYKIKK